MNRIIALPALLAAVVISLSGWCSPPKSGIEHIALFTRSTAQNPVYWARSWGVIRATGKLVPLSATDPNTAFLAVFPRGTYVVQPSTANTTQSGSVNPTTCWATTKITGATYTDVAGSGTGIYKGLTGSGTYSILTIEKLPRLATGACNTSTDRVPGTFRSSVSGIGPISIP
jgi:hypothetical protein